MCVSFFVLTLCSNICSFAEFCSVESFLKCLDRIGLFLQYALWFPRLKIKHEFGVNCDYGIIEQM